MNSSLDPSGKHETMAISAETETCLVIGIDLGTTFSGVSWVLTSDPKNVAIISQWSSNVVRAFDSDKVPTKLSYDLNNRLLSWGFDTDDGKYQVSWFKLLLNGPGSEALMQYGGHAQLLSTMASLGKRPLDFASDYLSELWQHTLEVLGTKIGESLVEIIQIKVVLTVPAIWNHHGQAMTRQAAANAGITRRPDTTLELVTEPEAAALATINDRAVLETGDTFVICDAGGGTVDLVSYKIEESKPLRLVMCTEATGGLFGATFLDRAFEELIIEMMGSGAYAKLTPRNKTKLMDDWEHGVKRNFKHNEAHGKVWHLDVPGYPGPARNILRYRDCLFAGYIALKTEQVEGIFQKICPQIVSLIAEQIKALKNFSSLEPRAVLLVGGFGENRYLLEEVKMAFPNLQVLQPNRAWSTISRGACQWGLDKNIVRNHIARYNYGVTMSEPFVDWKHLDEDRAWDECEEKWMAENQMKWYSLRGTNIGKTDPIRHGFYRCMRKKSDLQNVCTIIYYSDANIAPQRWNQDVKKLCTLTSKFPASLWDALEVHKNSKGVEYRQLSYIIEMIAEGASLLWRAEREGIESGRISVLAEYHLA